ncbi:IclR family transcriptional regulator [Salicibibacter cibi]|uniref:Glycerol operon regulatory protein n=1 Tax=Salicibibacter cibi TaxID=2743001 RepID=A0A7T6ZDM1_9BACI|nr:IclR family transcriptional regulator [Salicibibacter cibi]QQK81116.1 IclR family transcriptional regulator [Salicibibacter cibi]
MSKENKYSANSLSRGLLILTFFNKENPSLSLSEISKKLGVSRTVPYRLLYELQKMGYLYQDTATKRYSLTPKVLELGFSYINSLEFPDIAQPHMEKLRDEIGASCHLSILDGNEVVYICTAPVRGVETINVSIGMRLPAHATANGKLLLSFTEKIHWGSFDLESFTENTVISTQAFYEELKNIREQKYAMSRGELHPTISSVAVPIFNRGGSIAAALNVVIVESMFPSNFKMNVALPKALQVAKTLSTYKGCYTPNFGIDQA